MNNGIALLTESASPATVTSTLTSVASQITSTIASVAPVALGVVGAFLVWKYGIRFFKSLSK